jgi:hypothetical protein
MFGGGRRSTDFTPWLLAEYVTALINTGGCRRRLLFVSHARFHVTAWTKRAWTSVAWPSTVNVVVWVD